jgi:hypothetical protein
MDLSQIFTETIRSEWSTVIAHEPVTFALFGLGFLSGWAVAWLHFKERLNFRADRIEHLQAQIGDQPQAGGEQGILSVNCPNVFRDPKIFEPEPMANESK